MGVHLYKHNMNIYAAFAKVLEGRDPDFTIEKFLRTYDPTTNGSFVLREAASANNLDVVAALIADGRADPADQDNSAIKMAAMNGFYDMVKLLLADPRTVMDSRNNILGTAIVNGQVDVMQLLLDSPKVDPMANIAEHIKAAITFRYAYILEILLKRVEDTEVMMRGMLMEAMMRGMLTHAIIYYEPAVIKVLLKCPYVDASENDNHAIKRLCEMDADLDIIRTLLTDQRVDATCGLGFAIRLKKYDLVEVLLAHARNRRGLIDAFLDLQAIVPPAIAATVADRIVDIHYCPIDRGLWQTRASLLRMTAERDELAERLRAIEGVLAE